LASPDGIESKDILSKGNKMGTQAIVSLVKDGEVQMKVITGSDGHKAKKVADWLRSNPDAQPAEVYSQALEIGFGSKYDLVVQYGADKHVADPDMDDDLPQLYQEKFNDPKFNPRWEHGTADHVVVVKADAPAPRKRRIGP
jgi:hypothetical protein